MRRLNQLLKRLMGENTQEEGGSLQIDDPMIIEAFISNPENPFLVSFPRTGSHWLRMLMELYFERPSLVRVFYYPDRHDFLTLHTHDLKLDIMRRNVIYLYRDPVDTVYSQLNYYKESLRDNKRIAYWSELYARHLAKWLLHDDFTAKKTVLSYEGLRRDIAAEFSKITSHFGLVLDRIKLDAISSRITKEEVKHKTTHDQQVVRLAGNYAVKREEFRNGRGKDVWDAIDAIEPHIRSYFK